MAVRPAERRTCPCTHSDERDRRRAALEAARLAGDRQGVYTRGALGGRNGEGDTSGSRERVRAKMALGARDGPSAQAQIGW